MVARWRIPIAWSSGEGSSDGRDGRRSRRSAWAGIVGAATPSLYLALDARESRRGALLEVSVSLASAIELEWLLDLFPGAIHRERMTYYDESRSRVVAARQLWYHDLLLREDQSAAVDADQASRVLAQALRPEAARLIRASPQAALWLARLEFVKQALPELSWPEFNDEILRRCARDGCQRKNQVG